MVVIEIPSLGKDLILLSVRRSRKRRRKRCRTTVQPVVVQINQFLIRYRVNWTFIAIAILDNVCTNNDQPVHQHMIRSISTMEIVIANSER